MERRSEDVRRLLDETDPHEAESMYESSAAGIA
jgi:hypothetical protein